MGRSRPAVLVAVVFQLLPLAWSATSQAAEKSDPDRHLHLDCRSAESENELLLGPGVTAIALDAPAGSIWQLDELGVDLEFGVMPSAGLHSAGRRPARLGTEFGRIGQPVSLTVRNAQPSTLDAIGRLRLHCTPPPAIRRDHACMRDRRSMPAGEFQNAWAQFRLPRCHAPVLLDRASAAYRRGDLVQAERIYGEVALLWSEIGDAARGGAALVGLAESLTRQGRHQEALAHARNGERLAREGGVQYYAIRARAQQCLALRNLGRYLDATQCVEPLPRDFLDIGEISEAANTLHTIAAMAREDGEQPRARHALARALELPDAAIDDMVAGRLSQIGAGLAADSGHLRSALDLLDDALQRFERVRAPIWIGGAYLAAARLHIALGAEAEAATLAAAAEHHFRVAQAPERIAGAMMLLARVDAARGEVELALGRLDEVNRLYAAGARSQLKLAAALLALSLEPSEARLAQVLAFSGADVQLPPRARVDLASGLADYHLSRGDAGAARIQLEGIAGQVPDFERRIRFELLMARIDADAGRREPARERLEQAISTLRIMAADVASPALRQIVGRRLLELRAGWLATLSPSELATPAMAERALATLVRTQPLAMLASTPWTGRGGVEESRLRSSALQEHMAIALLGQADGDPQAMARIQRLIWSGYRDQAETTPEEMEWTSEHLNSMQAGLGDHELVIVWGLAEPASVALLVGRNHVSMHRVEGMAAIRRLAGDLVGLASDRGASIERIGPAADRLAHALLPASVGAAPERLWVVVEESLTAIPFALLRWPGTGVTLVDTTRLSVGPLLAGSTVRTSEPLQTPEVHVLAAQAAGEEMHALPLLRSVTQEPAWIRRAMPTVATTTAALEETALRHLLGLPGAWIHVAGHGRSRGGLQGHSGLWAQSPGPAGRPAFISWLDLVGMRLNAQLLVLNACDLAASGAGVVGRASGFASALHAAGVEQVVAALWPLSDSAAALWVPAFYESLAEQRSEGRFDPSSAVAAAQQRLRASRAFRHPFYWASLVHIAAPRLDMRRCGPEDPTACANADAQVADAKAGDDGGSGRLGLLASKPAW